MDADDAKPGRIRWEREDASAIRAHTGHVGALDLGVFGIFEPLVRGGDHVLTTALSGMGNKRAFGTPDELKAEAETWLEEFASSLGAVFPPAARAFRDELATALTRLELRVALTGPAARKINAESMADAIIQALEEANGA